MEMFVVYGICNAMLSHCALSSIYNYSETLYSHINYTLQLTKMFPSNLVRILFVQRDSNKKKP